MGFVGYEFLMIGILGGCFYFYYYYCDEDTHVLISDGFFAFFKYYLWGSLFAVAVEPFFIYIKINAINAIKCFPIKP